MKREKRFDCVEMQHRGAEDVRKATGNMSLEEQVAYWKERTATLRKRQGLLAQERKSA